MFEPKDAEQVLMLLDDALKVYRKDKRAEKIVKYFLSLALSIVLKVDEEYNTGYRDYYDILAGEYKKLKKVWEVRRWRSLFGLL